MDREFSFEHPPVELNEEKMFESNLEVAGYDARVFVSWNEVGRQSAPFLESLAPSRARTGP